MPTSFRLRPREERDLASLASLWVASWQEAMPEIDFSARQAWFLEHLATLEAAGAKTICAFDSAAQLSGFVNVDPATSYLDQLAVAPQAKGQGVAHLLLEAARKISPLGLILEVNQDNPRALRFYEKEGFVRIEEGLNPRSGLRTWRLHLSSMSPRS